VQRPIRLALTRSTQRGLRLLADLSASIFHLQLIANDIAGSKAESEVIAVFHTNAGHATLHDSAWLAPRALRRPRRKARYGGTARDEELPLATVNDL